MPPKEKDGNPPFICFNNYNRKMRVPFVVYADFECSTKKIDTKPPDDKNKSFTQKYQKHKPSAFCYYIKCFDDNLFSPKLVKYLAKSEEEDIPQMFLESLESDIDKIYNKFKFCKKANKSRKNQVKYDNATHCHICQEELGKDKVWDHCHLTGKFRGAAHNKCNLDYKVAKFFPVIFHNLSGYDAHLFVKNLQSRSKVLGTLVR